MVITILGSSAIFIALFVSLLVNNLIYLKIIKDLLRYLRERYSEKIKDWGLPDGLSDISSKRVPRLLGFLKSAECFNDPLLGDLKRKACFHLTLGYILFGIAVVDFVVLFVSVTILHKA